MKYASYVQVIISYKSAHNYYVYVRYFDKDLVSVTFIILCITCTWQNHSYMLFR